MKGGESRRGGIRSAINIPSVDAEIEQPRFNPTAHVSPFQVNVNPDTSQGRFGGQQDLVQLTDQKNKEVVSTFQITRLKKKLSCFKRFRGPKSEVINLNLPLMGSPTF